MVIWLLFRCPLCSCSSSTTKCCARPCCSISWLKPWATPSSATWSRCPARRRRPWLRWCSRCRFRSCAWASTSRTRCASKSVPTPASSHPKTSPWATRNCRWRWLKKTKWRWTWSCRTASKPSRAWPSTNCVNCKLTSQPWLATWKWPATKTPFARKPGRGRCGIRLRPCRCHGLTRWPSCARRPRPWHSCCGPATPLPRHAWKAWALNPLLTARSSCLQVRAVAGALRKPPTAPICTACARPCRRRSTARWDRHQPAPHAAAQASSTGATWRVASRSAKTARPSNWSAACLRPCRPTAACHPTSAC